MDIALLSNIAGESALYLGSLAWLAWNFERRQSIDGFHLVVAFAMGALVANAIGTTIAAPAWIGLLSGAIVAGIIDRIWLLMLAGKRRQDTLVFMIAGASVAMLAFDWVTAYTPLALAHGGKSLAQYAMYGAGFCWILIIADGLSRSGRVVRLGMPNRWAVLYWARPYTESNVFYAVAGTTLWLSVLTIPLATTGLLSGTILKDTALGILIGRIAGPRGPIVLFGVAGSLALMRTSAAYAIQNPLALPVVEAMAFIAMMAWLRYRTTRTVWDDNGGR